MTSRGCVIRAGVPEFVDFSEVSGYAQVKCRSSRVKVCQVIRAELKFLRARFEMLRAAWFCACAQDPARKMKITFDDFCVGV